jgi:hypothetical protein
MSGLEAGDAAAAVAAMTGGSGALVEIGIKARGLPDRDFLSKSDAMAVIFAADSGKAKNWSEVGRTDTVANSLGETRWPVALLSPSRLPAPASSDHHSLCPSCNFALTLVEALTPALAPPHPWPAAPEFRKPVRAAYSFERVQHMRIVIYDVDVKEKDNRKLKLKEQDFLGALLCPVCCIAFAAGVSQLSPSVCAHMVAQSWCVSCTHLIQL